MKSGIINQSINFFWTILCFAPVCWYWYVAGWDVWAWIFSGASILAGLLPRQVLRRLRFARDRRGYERLGVKTFRKLTQDGDWANAASGSAGNTIAHIDGAAKYLSTINMYERFHVMCGFFFLFTTVHAMVYGYWLTGGLVLVANFVFNGAAIILQQYNRLRIETLLRRAGRH